MKKLVLIIVSALLLIGLGVNPCSAQTKKTGQTKKTVQVKKIRQTKKQLLVENKQLKETLDEKNDSLSSLKKSSLKLKDENDQLQVKIKAGCAKLNKKVDSLTAVASNLQDQNQQLQFDEAVSYGKVEFLYSYTDSLKKVIKGLMTKNQQSKNGQTVIQPEAKVLDTMTWVTYELKDSVWVKITGGKTVKMPKKGEIGTSEDKTEIHVRETDFQAGTFSKEEIATWQFLKHKIMQVNK